MSWTDGARQQPSWISISPQGPFLPDVDGYPGLGLSSSGFLPRPGSSHGRAAVDPAMHRICRRQYSVPLGSTNRVRFSGGGRPDLAPDHVFSIGASCRSLCTCNGLSWLSAPVRAPNSWDQRVRPCDRCHDPIGTKNGAKALSGMANETLPATAFKSPAIALSGVVDMKCTLNLELSSITLQIRTLLS